jgi:hypothetical protein
MMGLNVSHANLYKKAVESIIPETFLFGKKDVLKLGMSFGLKMSAATSFMT